MARVAELVVVEDPPETDAPSVTVGGLPVTAGLSGVLVDVLVPAALPVCELTVADEPSVDVALVVEPEPDRLVPEGSPMTGLSLLKLIVCWSVFDPCA